MSLVAGLVATGLTLAAPPAHAADTDLVAIPDAVLHEAVNAALGAGRPAEQPVTVAEAKTLTSLTASDQEGVSDLTGLQAFTGLRSLSVAGDRDLADAGPLAKLSLTTLTLTGGALQGTLDSIGAITTLSSLRLADDRLFDVSPLTALTRLQALNLSNNQIADVTALGQLPSVVDLDLSVNRIADVTPVSRLTNPRSLNLSDNRIADVAPLARYSSMRLGTTAGALKVDGNRVSDLSTFLTFTGRPTSNRQSVYAGAYESGGVQVPLVRADSRVLPITATDPTEGAYDQPTKTLTLTDPAAADIAISPSWKVHLSDTPTDPTVLGTAGVGQTLKAAGGSVVKAPCEPGYQWQREGVDIAGAAASRYQVTDADVGSRLTARVNCGEREGVSAPTTSVVGATTGPAIVPSQSVQTGVLGDPTNPGITINVGQTDTAGNRVDPSKLAVTVTSDAPAALPASGITISGTGNTRTVAFAPVGRGIANLQFTVTGPTGQTSVASFIYGSSVRTTSTSRVLIGQGDASTALPAGDGYLFVADDERSEIGLYDPTMSRYATWESANVADDDEEVDFEASARRDDKVFWFGSHGNSKKGEISGSRHAVYETTVSGTGKDARLTRTGSYLGLRKDVIAWDRAHGDRLGLAAAAADGVKPDLANGFNLEGAEFSPDGSELYLGFRSPVVVKDGKQLALIVPVKNLPALTAGKAAQAQFGDPILLDLDGHDIREIRKNDAGQYLIVSGTPGMWTPQSSQKLFAWTGYAEDAAVPLTTEVTTDVEPLHTDNAGAWEGIGELPEDLTNGSQVRLIMDQGYDILYDTSPKAENKKNPILLRKSRTDVFTLTGNLGRAATVTDSGAFGDQAANTVGAPQVVTITNTGSERIRVKRVHVTGEGEQASDFLISQNTCAYTEPGPGASCRVAVRFAPAKIGTTSKARLVIVSNLDGASRTVELTGTSTTLPKGEPGAPGKDGADGKDGMPGAPGTITVKSAKATTAVKALSKRRLQITVAANGVDKRLLNQKVVVKVAGTKGSYRVTLKNGKAVIKLAGTKGSAIKAGKRIRVTVSVPKLTTRVVTNSTTATDYTITKTSKQQKVTVRK